jgi:hypothetical protein
MPYVFFTVLTVALHVAATISLLHTITTSDPLPLGFRHKPNNGREAQNAGFCRQTKRRQEEEQEGKTGGGLTALSAPAFMLLSSAAVATAALWCSA